MLRQHVQGPCQADAGEAQYSGSESTFRAPSTAGDAGLVVASIVALGPPAISSSTTPAVRIEAAAGDARKVDRLMIKPAAHCWLTNKLE